MDEGFPEVVKGNWPDLARLGSFLAYLGSLVF